MARRKFTREFKLSAVRLVDHQGSSVAEAARGRAVDPNCAREREGKVTSGQVHKAGTRKTRRQCRHGMLHMPGSV